MSVFAPRVETAYDAILQRISGGTWDPEVRLCEQELATRSGVSRTPVREALNRLVSEGVLERRPGFGCYVRTPSREEIAELYDLRIMLEGYAAERVASHLSRAALQHLSDLLQTMRQMTAAAREAGGGPLTAEANARWIETDGGFHQLILQAPGCRLTQATVSRLQLITRVSTFWLRGQTPPMFVVARMESACLWHARILKALETGDAKQAGKAMRCHIKAGKQQVLQLIQSQPAVEPISETAVGAESVYSSENKEPSSRS